MAMRPITAKRSGYFRAASSERSLRSPSSDGGQDRCVDAGVVHPAQELVGAERLGQVRAAFHALGPRALG
jgi:hypothetical protein